jgi:hypothetical protein
MLMLLHLSMGHLNMLSGMSTVRVRYKGGDAAGVSLMAGETRDDRQHGGGSAAYRLAMYARCASPRRRACRT